MPCRDRSAFGDTSSEEYNNALPAASRHVAEFPLRDVELHAFALQPVQADPPGELQQCFGKPRLEMAKHDVLDLFSGLP